MDMLMVLEPTIEALLALPTKDLQSLNQHRLHGNLQMVVQKAIAHIPSPPPRKSLKIDVSHKKVIELMGEEIGLQISSAEGVKRLKEHAIEDRLEDWAGPLADAREIGRVFQIQRSTLEAWRKRNVVIGLRKGKRRYVYPLDQFWNGKPVDGIKDVLQLVRYPRTAWRWLNHPKLSAGGIPLELLKQGKLFNVLQAAEFDFGEQRIFV